MKKEHPRISFGIIVLNGEPFTRYCLRQLYPHAHEIIVVEGGSEKAAQFAPEGRSTDGTLQILQEFKEREDPEDKVRIITRAGFWSEKDEQSQAYANRATGDYLWQVDVDEFYRHADIEKVRAMLAVDSVDAVSFNQIGFWGSPWIIAESFNLRSDRTEEYHRLFKWGPGYSYKTHRPPTVLDNNGIALRQKHWVTGDEMAEMGVFLFHYCLLFPLQVKTKCQYYATPNSVCSRAYAPAILDWAENSYFNLRRPFRVHNVYHSISWLRRIDFTHPEEAINMWNDAQAGRIQVQLRDNLDVEKLLMSRYYRAAAACLSGMASLLKWPPFKWGRRVFLACSDRLRAHRLKRRS